MQTFCSPLCAAPRRSRLRRNCSAFASIAQLAEHAPRKRKVASSILAGGYLNRYTGRWSRGMILRSGRRGRGFDSRTAPEMLFLLIIFFFFGGPNHTAGYCVWLQEKYAMFECARNLERGHPLKLERYRED